MDQNPSKNNSPPTYTQAMTVNQYPPSTQDIAIISQPQAFSVPHGITSVVAPGLECLLSTHQITVKLDAFLGYGSTYTVKNHLKQHVYTVAEDRDCCTSIPNHIHVLDLRQNEVIYLFRPDDDCCSCGISESMEISSPPGNIIGRIQEESTIFTPDFAVQNSNGEKLLRVKGGTFTSGFRILSLNGAEIGMLSRQLAWTDKYEIQFPLDLDVRVKALILGTCVLIIAKHRDRRSRSAA